MDLFKKNIIIFGGEDHFDEHTRQRECYNDTILIDIEKQTI